MATGTRRPGCADGRAWFSVAKPTTLATFSRSIICWTIFESGSGRTGPRSGKADAGSGVKRGTGPKQLETEQAERASAPVLGYGFPLPASRLRFTVSSHITRSDHSH